jgi:hypothetical protein
MKRELPELLHKNATRLLDEFCVRAANDSYQPRHLRYRIEGCRIDLYELRHYRGQPDQHQELPMAQIRYTRELNQWTLHHQRQDERWQIYLNITPSLDFSQMLQAIQQDPMGNFWQE